MQNNPESSNSSVLTYPELLAQLQGDRMPRHIAIIMDGNGRWARLHGVRRSAGHKAGVRAVRRIVETSVEMKLEYLTVYAFSTENWRRSRGEVNYLLKLILDSLITEIDELNRNNVNIRFIGSRQELSSAYYRKVMETCTRSWNNNGLHLNVAMNYGGRREIMEAFGEILQDVQSGKLNYADLDEKKVGDYLYTSGMPDPDLLIRTSGEKRLSNFLVWQAAYAEFWFTETLWPDFTREEFLQAIIDYQNRQRRFGARKVQDKI
ncbi:MAG: isoprenyl transferase [Candidatus Cloacimonetes bacterium]|nr:isoprenyl transferase [Candidatus Cloacimonadota bacterium]